MDSIKNRAAGSNWRKRGRRGESEGKNALKMRATGFEPATVGFGVQRSTVGATPSWVNLFARPRLSSLQFLINPLPSHYIFIILSPKNIWMISSLKWAHMYGSKKMTTNLCTSVYSTLRPPCFRRNNLWHYLQ